MVQKKGCAPAACFACARRWGQPLAGKGAMAGSQAGQAGPRALRVSPSHPTAAAGSSSAPQALVPASPSALPLTARSQIKVAKFSFSSTVSVLNESFFTPFSYPLISCIIFTEFSSFAGLHSVFIEYIEVRYEWSLPGPQNSLHLYLKPQINSFQVFPSFL